MGKSIEVVEEDYNLYPSKTIGPANLMARTIIQSISIKSANLMTRTVEKRIPIGPAYLVT